MYYVFLVIQWHQKMNWQRIQTTALSVGRKWKRQGSCLVHICSIRKFQYIINDSQLYESNVIWKRTISNLLNSINVKQQVSNVYSFVLISFDFDTKLSLTRHVWNNVSLNNNNFISFVVRVCNRGWNKTLLVQHAAWHWVSSLLDLWTCPPVLIPCWMRTCRMTAKLLLVVSRIISSILTVLSYCFMITSDKYTTYIEQWFALCAGSRYVSWLPSFSVEVTHAQPLRFDPQPAQTSQLDAMARQVIVFYCYCKYNMLRAYVL